MHFSSCKSPLCPLNRVSEKMHSEYTGRKRCMLGSGFHCGLQRELEQQQRGKVPQKAQHLAQLVPLTRMTATQSPSVTTLPRACLTPGSWACSCPTPRETQRHACACTHDSSFFRNEGDSVVSDTWHGPVSLCWDCCSLHSLVEGSWPLFHSRSLRKLPTASPSPGHGLHLTQMSHSASCPCGPQDTQP